MIRDWQQSLDQAGFQFSSANSINIGRLVPQIVYYVYAYATLVRQGKIKDGQEINVVVPTGNFGNILAAYYAKQMGLPIHKLICASNENQVFSMISSAQEPMTEREISFLRLLHLWIS